MLRLTIVLLMISISVHAKTIFQSGDTISAQAVKDNFNYYKTNTPSFGYVPVGTIVAFHKNFNNHLNASNNQDTDNSSADNSSLNLPEGWVECNGLNYVVETNGPLDPDGNGFFQVPDLNNEVYAEGKGRYLRGGSQSGLFNDSTAWDDNGSIYTGSGNGPYYGAAFGYFRDVETGDSISYKTSPLNPDNYRFQVTAMTVIYIMRIE